MQFIYTLFTISYYNLKLKCHRNNTFYAEVEIKFRILEFVYVNIYLYVIHSPLSLLHFRVILLKLYYNRENMMLRNLINIFHQISCDFKIFITQIRQKKYY